MNQTNYNEFVDLSQTLIDMIHTTQSRCKTKNTMTADWT
jgi:hypothetical protein